MMIIHMAVVVVLGLLTLFWGWMTLKSRRWKPNEGGSRAGRHAAADLVMIAIWGVAFLACLVWFVVVWVSV